MTEPPTPWVTPQYTPGDLHSHSIRSTLKSSDEPRYRTVGTPLETQVPALWQDGVEVLDLFDQILRHEVSFRYSGTITTVI